MQPLYSVNPPGTFIHQTVAELCEAQRAEGKPEPPFFEEYLDATTHRCYGQRNFSAAQLPPGRVVGVYGESTVKFTEPVWLDKGHRRVRLVASAKRPVECRTHIYAMFR